MSTDWQGITVDVGGAGEVGGVVDQTTGDLLLRAVRVEMPGWQCLSHELLVDEVEQRWRHGEVEAVVRQVWDAAWTLRVTLLNRGADAAQVPAPRLVVDTVWPARVFAAGGEAHVCVDPGRAEKLLFTQLQGHCRQDAAGGLLLAPDPLPLAGAGEQGPGQFVVSWRVAWLDTLAQVAQVLPAWWPRTAIGEGEEVWFPLPDAVVTSPDATVHEADEGFTVVGGPGRFPVLVHNRLGTTEVEVHCAQVPVGALWARGLEISERVDPRLARPWEVWLVARAVERPEQAEVEWLQTAVEECLARTQPAHPLEVMAACALIARGGADDLWPALEEMVGRLPAGVVGVEVAMVHVRLLAMQLGVVSARLGPRPTGPVAAADDLVERTLLRVEAGLLAPPEEPDEDIWRVAGLLGAGLPGEAVSPARLGQVCMLTAMFPEHWDFTSRWPVPLSQARQEAMYRLVASWSEPGMDEALGWLLVGM